MVVYVNEIELRKWKESLPMATREREILKLVQGWAEGFNLRFPAGDPNSASIVVDITSATREGVFQFLESANVVAVTVQPSDVGY